MRCPKEKREVGILNSCELSTIMYLNHLLGILKALDRRASLTLITCQSLRKTPGDSIFFSLSSFFRFQQLSIQHPGVTFAKIPAQSILLTTRRNLASSFKVHAQDGRCLARDYFPNTVHACRSALLIITSRPASVCRLDFPVQLPFPHACLASCILET